MGYRVGDNGGVALLDPAKVAGKVVSCLRGTTARTDKGVAVLEAGGAGMVSSTPLRPPTVPPCTSGASAW